VVQEEAKEENEKEVESKFALKVVLPNISQIHSCALHCRILGVEVNITKKALFFHSQRAKLERRLYMGWYLRVILCLVDHDCLIMVWVL